MLSAEFLRFFLRTCQKNEKCSCKRIANKNGGDYRRIGCIFFIVTHLKLLSPKSADSNDRNYVLITSDLFVSPKKKTLFSANVWFQLIRSCVLFHRFPVAASWRG